MATPKDDCEDCRTHTIRFNPENAKKIMKKQGELLTQGKRRSIEQVVNLLLSETK